LDEILNAEVNPDQLLPIPPLTRLKVSRTLAEGKPDEPGVAVLLGVDVAVGGKDVLIEVHVGVALTSVVVGTNEGDGVRVSVAGGGVFVRVGVLRGVGVDVRFPVLVGVKVAVVAGVLDGVAVFVGVNDGVTVGVFVAVNVGVGVFVSDGVKVGVGLEPSTSYAPMSQ